jgi:hypothetical protein
LTTGSRNTAVGHQSHYYNLTGDDNTYLGHWAGSGNAGSHSDNVGIGSSALGVVTTGSSNVAIGKGAGAAINTGQRNVAVGFGALDALTNNSVDTANGNVSLGYNSLGTLQTGAANIAIGTDALYSANGAVSSCTVIGTRAGDAINSTDANGTVALGYHALGALTSGAQNTVIGYQAADGLTTGAYNTVLGYDALGNATTLADHHVAIGRGAMSGNIGTEDLNFCVAVGDQAMMGALDAGASGAVAVGKSALAALTSGAINTAIGYQSMLATITGANNTALGYQSLKTNVDGSNNVAVGSHSLYTFEASSGGDGCNTAVGANSGYLVSTGQDNVLIGENAGWINSGVSLTTGSGNTLVGYQSAIGAAGGVNRTAIGKGTVAQADNSVTLGNDDVDHVYAAQDSVDTAAGVVTGAILHAKDIATTDGVLKENLLTNSGFDVWSNSTLENVGSDLVTNGAFTSDTGSWNVSGHAVTQVGSGGVAGGHASTTSGYLYQRLSGLTVGKLYKVTAYVKEGSSAGEAAEIWVDESSYADTDYGVVTFDSTSSWVAHSVVFETGVTNPFINLRFPGANGSKTIFWDSVSVYEVTPGCVAANALAMDGWAKEDNTQAKIYRQHSDGNTESVSKLGSFYSLKLVASASTYIQMPSATLRDNPEWYSRFAGRTVTFGCWVKGATASDVNLSIWDGTHRESTMNAGTGWEWLEVTYACPGTITNFQLNLLCDTAGTHYFSQPMLVFGNSIGSGNYTRPQGEWVYFEKEVTSNLLNSLSSQSDVSATTVNSEADSNGVIPKGAKAISFWTRLRDSGSAAGANLGLQIKSSSYYSSFCIVSGLANDAVGYFSGENIICTEDGDYQYVLEASGSGTLDITQFAYQGVQLR